MLTLTQAMLSDMGLSQAMMNFTINHKRETTSESEPTNHKSQITSRRYTAPSFLCQMAQLGSASDGFTSQAAQSEVDYTLFVNHNITLMKQKFRWKNCKFVKHNENHATHYLLIIQSFALESDFFSLRKKSLWVCHGDHSPGETRWTKFREIKFCKMLRNAFYTLFVVRTNFDVSSQFHCGLRIVCNPLDKEIKISWLNFLQRQVFCYYCSRKQEF